MPISLESLSKDVQEVGRKVDDLQRTRDQDREFLRQLHGDHLRLEGRVKISEEKVLKTQLDLDKHIEIACMIQKNIQDDVRETKNNLKEHMFKEEEDRKEIIKHLRETVSKTTQDNWKNLKWAAGVSATIVMGLFSLLWATGTIGV